MTKQVTEKWKTGHPPGPEARKYLWGACQDKGPDRANWARCDWCNTAVRYVHLIGARIDPDTVAQFHAGIDCGAYLTGDPETLREKELALRADTARRKRAGKEPSPTPKPKAPDAPKAKETPPDPTPIPLPPKETPPMPAYPSDKLTWMSEGWENGRFYAGPDAGYNVPGFRKRPDWENGPREILLIQVKRKWTIVLDQKLGAKRFETIEEAQSHAWDYCQWKLRQAS